MSFCRWVALTTGFFVVSCGLAPTPSAQAQATQEAFATVSIAPLDRLKSDAKYLFEASGYPEVWGFAQLMINNYTAGIDPTRPIGASVSLNGTTPSALIYLPMTDRAAFFQALAGLGVSPDDLGDGLFEIDTQQQVIYAKEAGGWLYVAQAEGDLASLPGDPGALLGELPNRYDVAIKLDIQELPDSIKEMAIEQMRMGFESGLAQQPGQTEEERQMAEELGRAQLEQIEKLMAETDRVILGYSVDQKQQYLEIHGAAQFVAGTQLEQQATAAKNLKSTYKQLSLPGSAADFRFASEILEVDREMAKSNFRNSMLQVTSMLDKQDMPEEARNVLSDLVDGLAAIMEQNIDEGRFDGAGSISVSDDTLRVLVGGHIADGQALAAEFKKAAKEVPEVTDAPKFEFDYENYNGVALHRVTVPVKIADPGAKRVFGDQLSLTIGTAEKSFMLCLDSTGDAAIKAAIDRVQATEPTPARPFESVIRLGDLLRFAQAVSPNSMLDNVSTTLQQFPDKDKIQIVGDPISRGGVYRLKIEEGVLQAIGAASRGGGGGGF